MQTVCSPAPPVLNDRWQLDVRLDCERSLKTPRRRHKTAPGRPKTDPRPPSGARRHVKIHKKTSFSVRVRPMATRPPKNGHGTPSRPPRDAPGRAQGAPKTPQDRPGAPQDRASTAPRRRPDRSKTAPRTPRSIVKHVKNTTFSISSPRGPQIAQVPRPSAQLARLSSLIFDNLTPDLTVSQPQRSLKTPRRRHKTAPGRPKTDPRPSRSA